MTAVLRGGIKGHPWREIDPNISIPLTGYLLANTPHPPLAQGWEETTGAALSSTREVIQHFKRSHEVIHLYLLIQCVTLLTFLRLFFGLPVTPTNIQEVVWIARKSWETGGCWQEFTEDPVGLSRLTKSSPNPFGVLTLLSATQRLVLSAVCLLEGPRDNLRFIRHARNLLRDPATPGSEAARQVEKILQSHPPVQSIHGRLSLRSLPLHQTYGVDFLIPADTLPLSDCTVGPDGECVLWLHKAGLPGRPACGGRAWLVRATTIILSAIETECRDANLAIDEDERNPEAWEAWVVRGSRVG
jgi:hypothetical protein